MITRILDNNTGEVLKEFKMIHVRKGKRLITQNEDLYTSSQYAQALLSPAYRIVSSDVSELNDNVINVYIEY